MTTPFTFVDLITQIACAAAFIIACQYAKEWTK